MGRNFLPIPLNLLEQERTSTLGIKWAPHLSLGPWLLGESHWGWAELDAMPLNADIDKRKP